MWALGAGQSPLVAGGVTIGGSLLAVLATLRYIKRTEDDSVDGLRETVRHLEQQCETCRLESLKLRRQLEQLVRYLRDVGMGVPDGFWD